MGWRVPEALRGRLAEPYGPIVPESRIADELAGCGTIVSVGDVVSLRLHLIGIETDVSIYDGRTKRETMRDFADIAEPDIVVENPAGEITRGMMDAVRLALDTDGHTRLFVDGEEDLASLAVFYLAPEGTCLIYGIPNQGMVLAKLDCNTSQRIIGLINELEELD